MIRISIMYSSKSKNLYSSTKSPNRWWGLRNPSLKSRFFLHPSRLKKCSSRSSSNNLKTSKLQTEGIKNSSNWLSQNFTKNTTSNINSASIIHMTPMHQNIMMIQSLIIGWSRRVCGEFQDWSSFSQMRKS